MSSASFEGVETASVGQGTLAYRERGTGNPVVFVHGSLSDLRSWNQQLPAIGVSYRAIAYSRRYAPPNDDIPPDTDDQMLPHVDDLASFLQAVNAEPAHIVGNSWGAFIALLTAIRYPAAVRSLVLQEPPVLSLFTSTPPRPTEIAKLFVRRPRTALAIIKFGGGTISPVEKAFRRGDDEAALERFAHGALGKAAYERLPPERKQQALDNLSTLRAQQLGAGFPSLSDNEVRSVRLPTLLMTGQRSPAFFRRMVEQLEELLPNVGRVEIADSSHAMQEQNPDATNEAILDFLDRN